MYFPEICLTIYHPFIPKEKTEAALYGGEVAYVDSLVGRLLDWLDDRDVIGAFNSLTSRFEPAACGLVERLVEKVASSGGPGDGAQGALFEDIDK